ncbi:hypothetical protein [Neisseria sp. 74A18]|uniref:hypothetical protein n=1 Tax=Neisseria sp. 74A18 TaxID=1696094 RepID=UPI0006CAF54A|nr:hypothetical protein [Neisseria sp. 74A18]KPN74863.1 hypothetical protein AKG43_00410 [Neisseria sp. 74A18]
MNKIIAAVLVACTLAACTGGVPKPNVVPDIAAESGTWFRLTEYDADGNMLQNSLLAVEKNAHMLRFVQTDALGAPLARQVLTQKGWRNDGFVMPNVPARRLFAAMLPVLSGNSAAPYPEMVRRKTENGECFQQHGRDVWCVKQADEGWQFVFPDQTKWAVVPIEE